MILKNKFFTNFILQFFYVLVGCFFDTLTFFCQKTNNFAQIPKRMNKYNFFKKKITFPQKMPLDARIAVVTTREKKLPIKRFLGQNPKKCERLENFQKMFFSKNFHGYLDCGFRKSGDIFR